ncbi:DUF4767 domain-containing protein [Lacticaseibacillus porcinae]|uniref:DUF4767 domain-containing protein n=1 Tax=Lacticaseibacillus porcinae TaxID=1123687 RepID=UPI000F77332E|nr:DUF4767 domain-containing protein [Lacticaseibacillus porcinae]
MKKLFVMGALVFWLGGCSQVSGPKESSSQVVSTTSSIKKSSDAKSTGSSLDANAHPYGNDSEGSYWTVKQDDELSKLMASWQKSMGQSFEGTYDGQVVDYLGIKYPEAIEGTWRNDVVYDQNEQLSWYQADSQGSSARFQVVAAAVGGKTDQQWPMLYLFALDTKDNSPVVLNSQTTNGGVLWFYETANTALKDGFAQIVAENGDVGAFTGQTEAWTKASAIDYMKQLDSRDGAIQAAVVAVAHDPGPDWNKATFSSRGRTAELSDEYQTTWSLTRMSDHKTVIVQRILGEEAPQVVFYATDSDHLVYEGYHRGELIVSQTADE